MAENQNFPTGLNIHIAFFMNLFINGSLLFISLMNCFVPAYFFTVSATVHICLLTVKSAFLLRIRFVRS